MAEPIIQLQKVTQTFKTPEGPDQIIKKATFDIEPDSLNVIYGPSGSGKSTLLNIMSGLQKPTTGTVTVQGQDLYKLDSDELAFFRANRLGIVYQRNYWVSSLSVLDNVALPLSFLGYTRKVANKMALDSLDRLGMAKYAHKSPLVLSGGEEQRIAIARALANNPLFIIADEPTGNLDRAHGDQVLELLLASKNQLHCTILLVTHNIEYLPVADKIFHVADGYVKQGNEDDVRRTTDGLLKDIAARLEMMSAMKDS